MTTNLFKISKKLFIISRSAYSSISVKDINPNVLNMHYAVRGPIVQRASELEKDLEDGAKLPFESVLRCNIGDCHATGQQPLTFLRQVVAIATYPHLLNESFMPNDAKYRAKRILDSIPGNSIGCYSESTGIKLIRQDCANYILDRDKISANFEDIFLTTGASDAIKVVLFMLSTGKSGSGPNRAGIFVPIPQYPLYSATNSEFNAHQINYYLDEANQWGVREAELDRAYNEAKEKCMPRAIVVINPGNPTGQLLRRADQQVIIRFAHRHGLTILADEVYQHNVYTTEDQAGANPGENASQTAQRDGFISFKKALHEMPREIAESVQLASFMSTSKGFMGECGFRGGYCELVNFEEAVKAQIYKFLTAKLCCSLAGQVMLDAVVNPPQPGEPSYEQFMQEKRAVLQSLQDKATIVTRTFNEIEGFQCNPLQGAMYAFPRIDLPAGAVKEAESRGVQPDELYCMRLLEHTGVCVVPGSGFGQSPGTHHFRITILPPLERMRSAMQQIREFHREFLQSYVM